MPSEAVDEVPGSATTVVVLGTGGTIAGAAEHALDNVGYRAAELGVQALIAAVPALAQVPLRAGQVAQVDSKDMDFAIWQALAQRIDAELSQPGVAGVVVTHGTDTLEETAYFLHRVLAAAKPVVLTAAMRPATSLQADGPQNLLDAVTLARWPGACGVLTVLAGNVYAGPDLRKVDSYRLDAFAAGDAGLLGRIEEGRWRGFRAWPHSTMQTRTQAQTHLQTETPTRTPPSTPTPTQPRSPLQAVIARDPQHWPRVEIVLNHAGADGRIVDALLAQGLDGLVLAGTGNGSLSERLEAAAARAQDAGVRVLRSSRCLFGRVIGSAGSSLPHAGALSPVQARIELLLACLMA